MLIELVRTHLALFDKGHVKHKDNVLNYDLWNKIGHEFGLSASAQTLTLQVLNGQETVQRLTKMQRFILKGLGRSLVCPPVILGKLCIVGLTFGPIRVSKSIARTQDITVYQRDSQPSVLLHVARTTGEPSLCCPTDDAFLVKFLRARKYVTQSAFTNVKKYFRVRTDHPELFKELTPSRILFDVVCRKNRLLTVSRHKDPMGRTAVLLKIGAWNTGICTLNDFLRVALVGIEYFLLREDFQVRGVVGIVDLKGLNAYHVAHFTPSFIRMLVGLIQECLPLRLKQIYIINNPPIFDFFFAIAKTFLKTKLIKRIRLFGYDLEELRHLVPDDVIPEEHGGNNESYDYDAVEKELKNAESFYRALGSYGYREILTETAPEPNGVSTDEELSSEDYVHL